MGSVTMVFLLPTFELLFGAVVYGAPTGAATIMQCHSAHPGAAGRRHCHHQFAWRRSTCGASTPADRPTRLNYYYPPAELPIQLGRQFTCNLAAATSLVTVAS